MPSRFPLPVTPICPSCDNPSTRVITSHSNRHGNAGRPYYYCSSGHIRTFLTWDDTQGIEARNPRCYCGYPSRRDRANGPIPSEWYACASKECGFRQEIEFDDTAEPEGVAASPETRIPVPSVVAGTASKAEQLDERMNSMGITEEAPGELEISVNTTPQQTGAPDVICPVHRSGRRWFFRRRRCIC